MAEEVKERRFREDLYYRINVMPIELPPLRSRTGDVPLLVLSFLGQEWTIESDALAALESFAWPGNVRQLINVIERAKILADDGTISLDDLPREVTSSAVDSTASVPTLLTDSLASIERAKVVEVLRREHGNKTRAAKSLGITRRSLYRLIDKYAIHPDSKTT